MKFSEQWLREWVNPPVTTEQLSQKLTSLGLEVDGVEPEQGDAVIELGLTPDRADCFSIRGVARDLSAAYDLPVTPPEITEPQATLSDALTIEINNPNDCPRYGGQIMRNVDVSVPTPDWILDRLKKSGVKPVNVVVDIGNYVLFELGQPMHIFDLDKLKGGLTVTTGRDETVTLIDETKAKLNKDTLVIADEEKVVAIAGVMGSCNSSVSDSTRNIYIESAFFNPDVIMGKARCYGVHSDGSQRFERGVDFELPHMALARAVNLIQASAGGECGPIVEKVSENHLPVRQAVRLSTAMLNRVLGEVIPTEQVTTYFKRLGFAVSFENDTWTVVPTSARFDISIPEDLAAEVGRLYGYDNLPETPLPAWQAPTPSETFVHEKRLKTRLIDRGYQELITYSFVDEAWQNALSNNQPSMKLLNPIASHMNVMRHSLWVGLLQTLSYNANRQMPDLRVFEVGQCFNGVDESLVQEDRIGGLISGQYFMPHWGTQSRAVNFYDLKADVEALIALSDPEAFTFEPGEHPALHPGQTAVIKKGSDVVGYIGALHPQWLKTFGIKVPVFLFEMKLASLQAHALPRFEALSKFPSIRRDLAVVVAEQVLAQDIMSVAEEKAGQLLKKIEIFDVYQGENIEKGKKSVALGLILQDSSRTLIDEDVNTIMQAVVQGLEKTLQATVRD